MALHGLNDRTRPTHATRTLQPATSTACEWDKYVVTGRIEVREKKGSTEFLFLIHLGVLHTHQGCVTRRHGWTAKKERRKSRREQEGEGQKPSFNGCPMTRSKGIPAQFYYFSQLGQPARLEDLTTKKRHRRNTNSVRSEFATGLKRITYGVDEPYDFVDVKYARVVVTNFLTSFSM